MVFRVSCVIKFIMIGWDRSRGKKREQEVFTYTHSVIPQGVS